MPINLKPPNSPAHKWSTRVNQHVGLMLRTWNSTRKSAIINLTLTWTISKVNSGGVGKCYLAFINDISIISASADMMSFGKHLYKVSCWSSKEKLVRVRSSGSTREQHKRTAQNNYFEQWRHFDQGVWFHAHTTRPLGKADVFFLNRCYYITEKGANGNHQFSALPCQIHCFVQIFNSLLLWAFELRVEVPLDI